MYFLDDYQIDRAHKTLDIHLDIPNGTRIVSEKQMLNSEVLIFQQDLSMYSIIKNIINSFQMNREDAIRPLYGLSQSTIVQSPYTSKQNPSFGANYSAFIEDARSHQVSPPFGVQQSTNSSGLSHYAINGNDGPSPTHYFQDFANTGNITLTKSTILEHKDSTDSRKNGNNLNQRQKIVNINKFVNMSSSKVQGNTAQEQPEQSSFQKQGSSPTNQYPYSKKNSQNFSFQFSPRKGKKSHQQGSIRQFIVVQPKQQMEKNNLNNYKTVELGSPLLGKRSSPSQGTNNVKFNLNAVPMATANSNTESPNSSIEHNKLLRREFSSGKLNIAFKSSHLQSPISNPDTNYFSYSNRKAQLKTNTQTPKSAIMYTPPVRQDFVTIKKLGKGKYGDVFLSQHRHIRIICALKVISKDTILKQEGGLNQFIREVTIQMYLKNPHIIQLWGIFDDSQNVYLIMEPALDGQLHKYMKQIRSFQESEASALIKQLCIGVQYLQSEKIIHRDLKPQNILLHQGKLKICDFGWAVYNQNNFRETFCGTPLYLSPDVLKGDQYNDKVDNWAIGIITYEMIVGRIPFKITQQSQMQKILNEEIQFPQHIKISEIAKDFILALLDKNPESRMDIEALLSHKFLSL